MKRKKLFGKKRSLGLPPGSLVYTGTPPEHDPILTLFSYSTDAVQEAELSHIPPPAPADGTVRWLNVCGLHDTRVMGKIGEQYGIHPLVLEDILNTDHHPKIEETGKYLFIIAKMMRVQEDGTIDSEQISLIVGEGTVLSFQEKQGDVFDGLRRRIRENRGRIQQAGADYLAYAMLDALIDGYFAVLEQVSEDLEALEDDIAGGTDDDHYRRLHTMKHRLLFLRKSIRPLRDVLSRLEKDDQPLIHRETRPYIRDAYDHVVQVIDMLETMRDFNTGLTEMYMSAVSNRMNEVMKVLTVIATIFIPLTFIAGIYGMNFRYMPELEWRWGYWAVLCVMGAAAAGMIFLFKRKRWF